MKEIRSGKINKKCMLKTKFLLIILMMLTLIISLCVINNNLVKYENISLGSLAKISAQEETNYIKRVYITSSRDKVSIKEDDYAMLEIHVVTNEDEDLGNVGTINYFQSSTDGGSVEIQDKKIIGVNVGEVDIYITVDYNGATYTSNTIHLTVQENYEIEYDKVTLYKYDADALFVAGGSVTDIENQGIYFAGAKEVTLGGVTFTTSDWNRWTKNIDGMDETMPYTGLAENELDADGNIQFTKPDYGIFDNTPSEGKEVYTRIGLPFVKQGNGFYIFDSSKYETYFPNGQPANDVNLEWSDQKVTYEGGWQRILSF